jgi:hypothetical protein
MHKPELQHNGNYPAKKPSNLRTIIINNQRIWPFQLTFVCAALILFSTAVFAAHHYDIVVADDFQTMTVEARFDRAIKSISARSQDAGQFLRDPVDCDTGNPLNSRSRRLSLPAAGIRCLSYTIDLKQAAKSERLSSILDDSNIAVSPTLWMWRPRLGSRDEIIANFSLGGSARVFVPWERIDNDDSRYRLTASPQSGSAIALFGEFQQSIEHVGGAQLRVILPTTHERIELQSLLPWVQATANNIAGAYGTFPNPNTNIFLIPVGNLGWDSERAVSFGRVVRDGGETFELMINQNRPISQFYQEWTPVHEFSHLMLPYLDRDQRWISEGFAQYYQNVFLARAAQHSTEDAWRKIYDGLERGRESAPGLSPNDAASAPMRDARMKVYWSGASIALMADVELRRRSGGRDSLDSVLGQLQQCCLPSSYAWSGAELFRKLDELLDEPLFVDLYRQYANADHFPDARPILTRLGVSVRDGRVVMDKSAELSTIRIAITNPAPEPL